ncbi:unnamed protein product [Paramecium primaurelia]|uniref:Tetratricopeptide repeat protein n=1 Tax=Paramecium primaurelia TaxID=5886 RepID=A0A8S1QXK6_PARPR|nr:unnamed protein product [Paramecium primaurelia]
MIQQCNLKIKCQKDDHQDEIDTVCYNQFCQEFRLNCFKCMKKGRIHNDHFDDVEKINSLIQFIDQKNQECDKLIDDLNKLIEIMNQSFSQLKRGIIQKYQLYKQRLILLNSQQINDYLNSTIQFKEYQQSITKIISEQTNKLNHSFNNLYQQLNLSQFNYYQIDNNSIQLSKQLYDKGYKLYWEDKYLEAIEVLNQSIQQDPNNHQSLWCKGDSLRGLNKYEDAITWYDKALIIDTKHVDSLCGKGICLRQLKKYDESLKILDLALTINPQHNFSLQSKGAWLEDQQNYKEALIYYEKSLKINPNDQWTINQKKICENKLKQ